ncbi:MAG TPA: amidohydrolase family protein [Vicinamibacterales bacterium]|nr:amidohydrolase family protein [Vicinamibacterales bacterium]
MAVARASSAIALVLLWAGHMGPGAQTAPTPALALTGVTIIDGTGAPPAPGMTILIADGRITDVFESGAKPLPAGAETRDLGGRFVIPGLIDSHTHLVPLGSPENVDRELGRMLRGGIVAAREMAGNMMASRRVRERTLSGELAAPDLYYPLLTAGPGFFAADPRPGRAGGPGPAPGMISSPADIVPAVGRAVAAGASAVKIYAQLDVPTMRALIEEAHRRGLKVWAHPTIYPARPLDVVRAGVDGLTHACGMVWQDADLDPSQYTAVSLNARPRFDPKLVDADGPEMTALFDEMVRRGVHFEPTLANHARPGDDQYGCTTEVTVAVTRAAKRAGVMLLAGTDFHAAPGAPHPSLHQEIRMLVSSGVLTPLEAISAATYNPARAMGLDADLGSIAPGKAASLVVLEANPAGDIAAIGRIVFVMKAGRIYER